jgi:hypothetical protein
MSFGDHVKAAEPYIIGIAVPLVVGLICIILPTQLSQQAGIASITTKLDEADKKMDLRVALLEKSADLRMESVLKRIDDVGKKVETDENEIKSFEDRVSSMETDPKRLLERLGIAPDATFTAVSVRNELYVLPRSVESAQSMAAQGYERRQISPMVAGFIVQPARSGAPSAGLPNVVSPFPAPIAQPPKASSSK